MPFERDSNRIVIAGASSLLGAELKSLLEESRFAGWDFRLVDEEVAAGTLTETGGEPAVIQLVEEDSFQGARFAFLSGSPGFSKRCLAPALRSGAKIIDFSPISFLAADAVAWFPKIEALTGKTIVKSAQRYAVLSAPGAAIASLALALKKLQLKRMVVVVNQSVSEVGRAGIEELETQTSQLLSFQRTGNRVFGVQSAFNTVQQYGPECTEDLRQRADFLHAEISAAMEGEEKQPRVSIQVVHSPVFYGTTLAACADLERDADLAQITSACKEAGFVMTPEEEAGPSNVSVGGESSLTLGQPREESGRRGSWWFWCAADNIRYPAASGVKLAEILS